VDLVPLAFVDDRAQVDVVGGGLPTVRLSARMASFATYSS